jgi:transcriptional regulator with XRE-family HTH domain
LTGIGTTYIVGPDMGTALKPADRIVLEAWASAVKHARHHAGLSQVELAERCGIAQSTLSKIENADYRQMHPQMVLRLCDALDIDPNQGFAWPPAIVEIARMRKAAA